MQKYNIDLVDTSILLLNTMPIVILQSCFFWRRKNNKFVYSHLRLRVFFYQFRVFFRNKWLFLYIFEIFKLKFPEFCWCKMIFRQCKVILTLTNSEMIIQMSLEHQMCGVWDEKKCFQCGTLHFWTFEPQTKLTPANCSVDVYNFV